jgi:hypothetical protein
MYLLDVVRLLQEVHLLEHAGPDVSDDTCVSGESASGRGQQVSIMDTSMASKVIASHMSLQRQLPTHCLPTFAWPHKESGCHVFESNKLHGHPTCQ